MRRVKRGQSAHKKVGPVHVQNDRRIRSGTRCRTSFYISYRDYRSILHIDDASLLPCTLRHQALALLLPNPLSDNPLTRYVQSKRNMVHNPVDNGPASRRNRPSAALHSWVIPNAPVSNQRRYGQHSEWQILFILLQIQQFVSVVDASRGLHVCL